MPIRITTASGDLTRHRTDLGLVLAFEGEDFRKAGRAALGEEWGETLGAIHDLGDFKGKAREVKVLPGFADRRPARGGLLGLGKRSELDLEEMRRAAAVAVRTCESAGGKTLSLWLDSGVLSRFDTSELAQALAEGLVLASYRFDRFRTSPSETAPSRLARAILVGEGRLRLPEAGIERGRIFAEATNYARHLGDLPANVANPAFLGEEARKLGRSGRMRVRVFGPPEIQRLKMGALLGVASGSESPARFIVLELTRGRAYETVVLVGKGITFDSGGLSIKPAQGMEDMKFDMCGAAAVLGTLKALRNLDSPVNVVGLIPSTENLPGGRAYRPGDILTTCSGKTIEVLNTDAEGRLILADALSYAQRYEPAAVVDLATLTGACVVALGHEASGLFGTDEKLVARLERAAERSGERVWRLPLWKEYDSLIESKVADVKNTGGRFAGAITAAAFLKKFAGDRPWAHLDIAGTAWEGRKRDYYEEGASGVGVRLLLHLILDWKKRV